MTEKEKRVLDTIEKVLPLLSDREKDSFLSFGEGVYFKAMQDAENRPREPATA